MKTKTIKECFIKHLSRLLLILTMVSSIHSSAQQSMSLGSLQFVMPTQKAVKTNRTIHLRMARTGISARVIARVGGVAFIQTAEPEFTINSLSLGVDYHKNGAYAVINDTTITIPLEVWELQSIVNYANQEDNAAVTLFGDNGSRIQYHDAFLDNLMGLRILQTDLILTGFLRPADRGKLPAYADGEFILSPNEEKEYKSWNRLDSFLYDAPYDIVSQYASYKVINAIDSIGESYDTYIYTDYDQPIRFNHSNGDIKFDGKPYYRFASRDSALVDTLEMYYELKNFVDTFNLQRQRFKDLSISKVFKKTNNPVIYDLAKLTSKNKNIQKKVVSAFEMTNYYALCDTFEINRDKQFINFLRPAILKAYVRLFSDSIVKHGSGNPELDNLCAEFMAIKDSLRYYDYPIVNAYANKMYSLLPTDSTAKSMYEAVREYRLTYDRLLIEYMYDKKIPAAKMQENITNYLREHRTYTYMINPIVFDAAEKACQWSAFFRYVKENYNDEWSTFVDDVKRLKYDAPIVQTPVDFSNDSSRQEIDDDE